MRSAPPSRRPPRPLPPTDIDELIELAERLNGRPVPGVRLTERQFERWGRHACRAEWVDGEVTLLPYETPGHDTRELFLATVVGLFVEHYDLGRVFAGTVRVRLPGQRRQRCPDVAFVSTARLT